MVSGRTHLSTQHRQDQGAGGGFQGDRAENTHPSPSTSTCGAGKAALSSSAFTSPRISHGLLHRCSAEEGTSAPLLPETAEEVWNEPQNPQILLHLHCGEHPDAAASPPGLETAPLATAKLCKGSCELPANCWRWSFPPSRISTRIDHQGLQPPIPQTILKFAVIPVACAHCPTQFHPSSQLLICFDKLLPPLSLMTLCYLPSLWRVSMIVFWTIVKSAVVPIIVVSNNKRYPEFILYGWSFIETQM